VLILVMIYNCHAFAPKTFLLSTGSRSEFRYEKETLDTYTCL
jgi:hypothetical protein